MNAESAVAEYARVEKEKLADYESRIRSWPIDVSGARVLDLGAGPGHWGLLLDRMGVSALVSHDNSREFQQIAREMHARHGVAASYVLADLIDLGRYADRSFDLVLSRLAVYFASNEYRLADQIARIAAKWIYIEAPSWRWSWRRYRDWTIPIRLVTPVVGLATRKKLFPTNWSARWFWYARLRRHGFMPIWEQHGEGRQAWRTLFERVSH